jgi:hypothetical protein
VGGSIDDVDVGLDVVVDGESVDAFFVVVLFLVVGGYLLLLIVIILLDFEVLFDEFDELLFGEVFASVSLWLRIACLKL